MRLRHFAIAAATAALAACVTAADDPAVERAKADLAVRLGVAADTISVVRREEKTWPDGSLGCPQPGMGYTQALVDGSLLVLAVDGKQYNYHAGGNRDYFLCETLRAGQGGVTRGVDVGPADTNAKEKADR